MRLKISFSHWLALLLPAVLLAGAYGSQYFGGLFPCEMCWWQRYPHYAAVAIAVLAFAVSHPGYRRALVALAALAIATSGAIAGFHAGVEYGWWEGLSKCAGVPSGSGADVMKQILAAPTIRCDVAPWTLFGISLAGFNFLLSTGGAVTILGLIARDRSA